MRSRIYVGEVMHNRLTPVSHKFTYPVYTYCFDLNELEELERNVKGFGYNHFNVAAVHDKDYLQGEGSIREKLFRFLEDRGCADRIARIEVVTMARFFNYVFNPVSFYYCYRDDGSLRCAVAEVNNTFGDRHVYILDKPLSDPGKYPVHYTHPKEFHVSPFNNMEGQYDFRLSALGDKMNIGLTLIRDGERVMIARLSGTALPLNSENLRRTILRYPLTAALNVPRITWEAATLYYRKKLPFHHRPYPNHPMTIGIAPPSATEKLGMKVMSKFFGGIKSGYLEMALPDGTTQAFGDSQSPERHRMTIHSYDFFSRVLRGGDIGFGESYTAGDWDCEDLTALLMLFIRNSDALDDRSLLASWLGRIASRIKHELNRNTLFGSSRNIEAHYDLGNDFYTLFLDHDTMLYSCAFYNSPDESLAEAQKNKLNRIIEKARLGPDTHVLEIGCGWGGFAMHAARTTGCRVTGITLSHEQLRYAGKRAQQEGLDHLVDFKLCDYRLMEGQFDRIVSIEMLEAVGHEYYGSFFRACDRLLKPEGLVVLQVITIPDQRYDAYRRSTDWIQKHIFPGGVLPSITALSKAMTKNSDFFIEELDNIGPHYAPTLKDWRDAFEERREDVRKLGFDEDFLRKWRYYFCYCEAGFAARYINDLHLVLTRAKNTSLNG